jgi:hypothetical protein
MSEPRYTFRAGIEPTGYHIFKSDEESAVLCPRCTRTPDDAEFPLYFDDIASMRNEDPIKCDVCDSEIAPALLLRKNRYYCETCKKSIITMDRDEGVTPMMLPCMRTSGCPGPMVSRFYQVEDVWPEPTYVWRKPTAKELKKMSPAMKEHVAMGGLEIYPIQQEEKADAGA